MSQKHQVFELLPGDRAIVSTEGLYRVEHISTGEIVSELLTDTEADRLLNARVAVCADPMEHYRKLSYAEVAWEATA